MNRARWFAIGAATVTVVLGGGAALAASGSSDPASTFLGDVAERLGISEGKLEGAIEDATIARIDADVAAGRITKKEGEALKDRVRSGDGPLIVPSFRGPGVGLGPIAPLGLGLVPGLPGGVDLPERAADYLGMDAADVRGAMRDGKSLAELAKDNGKSVEGLKNALRDAIREDADKAVEDGLLTKDQADHLVEKLSAAVDELVEAEHPPALTFGPGGPGVEYGPVRPAKPGLFPGGPPGADPIATALDYLGLDGADLREAVRDGKSLADLAKDKGRSVDGLKEALRDAIRKDADKAIEDGVLTKEQADRLVEKFGNAVDKFVERRLKDGFDFKFEGGGRGFGLRLHIAPEGGTPAPRGPGDSSFGPTIVPPQPI
jgi:lambda repressor-like predicted transcriptional regulator